MVGQPKHGEGTDDHQDEAAPLRSALEAGTLQTAEHRGVAGVDEGERQQATHNSLKQVLEDLVAHAAPVIYVTRFERDVQERLLYIAVGKEEDIKINKSWRGKSNRAGDLQTSGRTGFVPAVERHWQREEEG